MICLKAIALMILVMNLQPSAYAQNPPSYTVNQASTHLNGEALARQTQRWQKALKQVAQNEQATLFIDIGTAIKWPPPFTTYSKSGGVEAMKALSLATNRGWKQIDGVQTFTQTAKGTSPTYGRESFQLDRETVLKWIKSANPLDRQEMTERQLSSARISPEVRECLLRMAGYQDQELPFVLLDKNNHFSLKLQFAPRIEYTSPRTGAIMSRILWEAASLEPEDQRHTVEGEVAGGLEAPGQALISKAQPVMSLQRANPGPLDFGQGVVLPLTELLRQASAAFGGKYEINGRAGEHPYFVAGSFTRQTFEAVLQAVTVAAMEPAAMVNRERSVESSQTLLNDLLRTQWKDLPERKLDFAWLRKSMPISSSKDYEALELKYGSMELVPAADFLKGKIAKVADFTHGKPGLSYQLKQAGLSAETPVTLRAGLVLILGVAGYHESPNSVAARDGRIVRVLAPNSVPIALH